MKRTRQDVVGRPTVTSSGSSDVAGASTTRGLSGVAGVLDVMRDACVSDASVVEEFAEFLAGDEALDMPPFPAADPIFRERLRRRLWRMHLLTHDPGFRDPH